MPRVRPDNVINDPSRYPIAFLLFSEDWNIQLYSSPWYALMPVHGLTIRPIITSVAINITFRTNTLFSHLLITQANASSFWIFFILSSCRHCNVISSIVLHTLQTVRIHCWANVNVCSWQGEIIPNLLHLHKCFSLVSFFLLTPNDWAGNPLENMYYCGKYLAWTWNDARRQEINV